MKFIASFIVLIAFNSCRDKSDKFNYETSIATTEYKAQLQYLDNTLFNYARISDTGSYYYNLSAELDEKAEMIKEKIRKGNLISKHEQEFFLNKFEKTFGNYPATDIKTFKELQEIPIKSVSDVDIIRLFIKNNFVAILLNNKLLPFDSWGIMVSGKNEIKEGEELQLDLATYAFKAYHQNEWYLVNKGLSSDDTIQKDNIIDTLFPDNDGIVHFKTKNYKKGENKLVFLSRLNHPPKDRMVIKEFLFYVK